ncbi:MAG TPA: glycosyltransferase family 87 protein [Thermoanaerobaculia bacterium]|nr:glycosyltransferase family 87 protein [Thermoanaerobaculia bacterium]
MGRLYSLAVAAGILARLYFVAFTVGTTDVIFKTMWGHLAAVYGVAGAYAHHPLLNHPPLSVFIFARLYDLAPAIGLEFANLLRLLQVLADIGSAACLFILGRRYASLFFFLSPAAIFISGFHCNTDPTMVCLILAAVVFFAKERPVASGIALGLATGIKILPLLIVPLFFIRTPRRWRFAIAYALTFAAIFAPVLLRSRAAFSNIFLYRSVGNWWGPVSMLTWLHRPDLVQLYSRINVLVLLAVVSFAMWRFRARDVASAIAFVYLLVVALGAGFGVQYLLWPLAFLPFALSKRWALAVNALISFFLFVVYTAWSGELPWNFADAQRPGVTTDSLVFLGWVVWLALIAASVASAIRSRESLPQWEPARSS